MKYGLVWTDFKRLQITGENEKVRDKLLEYIMEVQKERKVDDMMGFGLFD